MYNENYYEITILEILENGRAQKKSTKKQKFDSNFKIILDLILRASVISS